MVIFLITMEILYTIINSAPGVPDWAFIVLCFASFFTSVVSAAFGLGGGAMMVAIMASLVPPIAVIPVHAVVQVSSNFTRALMMWKHIKFTWMIPFVIGTIIGALIGGQIVFAIPKHLLQGIIGIFVVRYGFILRGSPLICKIIHYAYLLAAHFFSGGFDCQYYIVIAGTATHIALKISSDYVLIGLGRLVQ